jgi:hypothetical protein
VRNLENFSEFCRNERNLKKLLHFLHEFCIFQKVFASFHKMYEKCQQNVTKLCDSVIIPSPLSVFVGPAIDGHSKLKQLTRATFLPHKSFAGKLPEELSS